MGDLCGGNGRVKREYSIGFDRVIQREDCPGCDACTPAQDIPALEQELAKITAHPEWGQGPGTPYYAQVQADLAEARRKAAAS